MLFLCVIGENTELVKCLCVNNLILTGFHAWIFAELQSYLCLVVSAVASVCVDVCFYVTAWMLEKVKHQQPAGRVLPGLCGGLWGHMSSSSAGWGLKDVTLNSSAGAHVKKKTADHHCADTVWAKSAFVSVRWCLDYYSVVINSNLTAAKYSKT